MQSMARWSFGLSGLVVALFAGNARASDVYPGELAATLMLTQAEPCTLCHQSDAGGDGTVVTPFGRSMILLGATGNDNRSTLREALQESDRKGIDSDGDGYTDLDELRAGEDPNDNPDPGAVEDLPVPEHGCAVSVTRERASSAIWWLILAAFGARAWRRKGASGSKNRTTFPITG